MGIDRRLACAAALALAAGAMPAAAGARLHLGEQLTCVVTTSDDVACAGAERFRHPAALAELATANGSSFGLRHGCLLDAGGVPRCWGDGSEGQLGVATAALTARCDGRPCRRIPAAVPQAPPLVDIEAGWLHTCGVTRAGGVVCWGDGSLRQLGRAAAGPVAAPVEGLASPAVEVAAGGLHSCARLAGGGVACWGDGSYGQLGSGHAEDSPSPVAVSGLPRAAVEVVAGAYHSCARLDDGSVACWGDNRFGQLGDGTRTSRPAAVPVRGLPAPAVELVAGSSFNCARLGDGRVVCWGSNELGELGVGRFDPALGAGAAAPSSPAPVSALGAAATGIAASGNHACARLESGAVSCWGANESGQLGDGSVEARDLPVAWRGRAGTAAPVPAPEPKEGERAFAGIDVSYHSGRVDWARAVAEGHRFALTLATAGVDFRDPFFAAHWERMRQAGLVRGAYHYFVAADDPAAQARVFLSHVLLEAGDLAPVVDIESRGHGAPADLPARLRAFLDELEQAIGVKPIIYTGPTFWNANMNDRFGEYPLWIAHYDVPRPTLPAGWKRWHLWQWRGNADLPAVAPLVDLDRLAPDVELGALRLPQRSAAP